jgi:hypothetical protein
VDQQQRPSLLSKSQAPKLKMPILYALVARGKNVLAEYTSAQGNFPTVTRVLLSKIPDQDGKMSYVYDSHVFHYVVDNGITFLCMADEGMKRRLTFAFLDEIKRLWRHEFTAIEQTALAFSLNDQFSPILRQQIVCLLLHPSFPSHLPPSLLSLVSMFITPTQHLTTFRR